MKKVYLFLLFGVASIQLSAQEEPKFTLTFTDATILEVIEQIESRSEYKFYFYDEWFDGLTYTGQYSNITLRELLAQVFENTPLNFYLTSDSRIILTRNTIIYDMLPDGFFGEVNEQTNSTEIKPSQIAPVFYDENAVNSATVVRPVESIRIGKEELSNRSENYEITGTIINSANQGVATNVAVIVPSLDIGAVSDETGSFRLVLPSGVHDVEFNSLEYQLTVKRFIVYGSGEVRIELNESYEGLEEVVIEANVDRNVKETSVGKTKIEVENIKNIPLVLGERDIFKAAATLPGISSAGEGATGYNVRGGTTDQNLILLDDGVIYNPAHFFGIFSAINPFTTDDVTIYKGNIPARYGGRLSSVFDIRTRDANVQEFSGEASIGPVTSNLVLETPIVKERSGLMLGGRSTFSDWILRNLDEEELRNSEARFFDAILRFNSKMGEKGDISATAYYSRDAFSITSDSLYGYSNRMVALRWNRQLSEKHSGSLILTNSNYQFDIEFDGQSNDDFDFGYSISETEFKANFHYVPNKRHRFNYGISSKLYKTEPGRIDPGGDDSIITPVKIASEKAVESAVYISDEFKLNDRLSFEGGVRLSFYAALGASSQNVYQEGVPRGNSTLIETREFGNNEIVQTYGAPEFRFSSRYLFDPTFSVKGSVNTRYQYIHTLSSNTTVSPIDTWKLSDLNIRPQKGIQYSLGFFKNLKENMYEFSVEGYFKSTRDLLDYKVGASLLLNESLEQDVLQGDGRAYGIEFLLKKTKGRFNGWLGYTYSRSEVRLDSQFLEERVNGGEFFPANFDKPHDISLVANFKITKRFSFSGNFVYQTGRPVTVPIGNFVINNSELVLFSERNEFRIPDFYRLDLSFNMEGNHKRNKLAHSFWNFSVYNVLGRNNPFSVFFVSENGEIKALQSSIFAIPIPSISYNLKF